MESRIILSTADFRQNNIGRYVELSGLTRKVLTKQTQYREGDSEAFALNAFLEHLTEDGFIGGANPKLSVLMIPALAAADSSTDNSELFFNICSLDANGYPQDWSPTNKGIYFPKIVNDVVVGAYVNSTSGSTPATAGAANAFNLGKTYFVPNQVIPSFTLFNYTASTTPNATSSISQYANQINVQLRAGDSAAPKAGVDTGVTASTGLTTTPIGFIGMIYNGTDGSVFVNVAGTTATSASPLGEVTAGASVAESNTNFGLINGNNWGSISASAIVGFGDGMTTEELATFKGYCDTLAAALHITN